MSLLMDFSSHKGASLEASVIFATETKTFPVFKVPFKMGIETSNFWVWISLLGRGFFINL